MFVPNFVRRLVLCSATVREPCFVRCFVRQFPGTPLQSPGSFQQPQAVPSQFPGNCLRTALEQLRGCSGNRLGTARGAACLMFCSVFCSASKRCFVRCFVRQRVFCSGVMFCSGASFCSVFCSLKRMFCSFSQFCAERCSCSANGVRVQSCF